MKFLSLWHEGKRAIAVVGSDGRYRGLTEEDAGFPGHLDDLVASGPEALASAGAGLRDGRTFDPASMEFDVPLRRSGKIICVGLNYRDHAAESGMHLPEFPTLFPRFGSSLVAHDAPLLRPAESDRFDYEGELVAVVGRGGRRIPISAALDHVLGYSIFNDGSIRDYQLRTPQWTMGKNFDGTGAFGPILATADELPPGAAGLRLRTRLNGEVLQDGSTADLIFDVAALVSMISIGMTLEPGDMIVTGTPAGVGAIRKPPVYMKAGDVSEIEIEGIGTLRNRVVDDPG